MPTTHCYKKVYIRLLQHHVNRGFSPESFAGLQTNQHKVRQEDPQATWIDDYGDFVKHSVHPDVVERWKQKHPAFQEAYEECWSRGLLFYEQRLLECLDQSDWRKRPGLQILLFVLRTRFRCVEGQRQEDGPGKEEEAEVSKEEEMEKELEIKDINDPKQLLYIAHGGQKEFRRRGSGKGVSSGGKKGSSSKGKK